jgi:hypothetical protein
MSVSEFVVEVYTVEDPNGGSPILPSDLELEEEAFRIAQDERYYTGIAASPDTEESAFGKSMLNMTKRAKWDLEETKKAIEILKPKATVTPYTLVKPKYGPYFEAEGSCKQLDARMNPVVDRSKMMHELIPSAIKGIRREEFLEQIDVDLAEHLWNKLSSSISPSRDRLHFLASCAKTRSKASSQTKTA